MNASHAGGETPPLPALLTVGGAVPFVARPSAWTELERAWDSAAGAARRVVLVAGEAGTGKTRVVTEFAQSVHAEGAVVLYGACSEEQTVPYQPFAEALDPLHDRAVADLAWLSADSSDTETAERASPDVVRVRRFRAAASALADVAADGPLLLVLDDLHWARRPTIELLTHLVRDQSLTNTLVVGTYRSTPADVSPAFRDALPQLHRTPGVSRLRLTTFDTSGIADFLAAAVRALAPLSSPMATRGFDQAVGMLARQTDGNPFLLVELWLHLVDTGHVRLLDEGRVLISPPRDLAAPEGVREVVGARLARLDPHTRELLEVAAVIGPVFSPSLVAGVLGGDVPSVLAALDPAGRSRLIDDSEGATLRFAHELIRRSIYDGLGTGERRRLHHAVAAALETDPGAVAERARHLLAAVPVADPRTAVAAARVAARAAARAVTYDDAARFLDAALAYADVDRGATLLEAASAMMRSGDAEGAKARCVEAHDLARRDGDRSLQIDAALAYGEASWRDGRDADVAASLLRSALGLATGEQLRRRLQTALTRALAIAGEGEAARLLGEDALRSAREAGDDDCLRAALDALSYAPWTPQTIERQLAYMREAVGTARRCGDLEWESLAIGKLLYGEITSGDLVAARATERRQRQVAGHAGQPLFVALAHQADSLLALADGRLADAERLAEAAEAVRLDLSESAAGGYGVQLFSIRREQGRLEEARPVVEAIVRSSQQRSAWRPALAVMHAELGMLDEAASELRLLTADRLATIPRDALWVGALSYLADAARIVGDTDAAAAVYDELAGWRGLVVHVGFLLAAHGAVDRYLGELAGVLGWEREAEIHFEAGLALDESAGMALWIARSQLAYGRFLAGGRRSADAERADALLSAARSTADRLGLVAVAEAARVAHHVPAATGPAGLTEREVAVVGLMVEGCSNREIGRRLHISQHTAANHVRSILMKTACANRTEAATWAVRHGLHPDP